MSETVQGSLFAEEKSVEIRLFINPGAEVDHFFYSVQKQAEKQLGIPLTVFKGKAHLSFLRLVINENYNGEVIAKLLEFCKQFTSLKIKISGVDFFDRNDIVMYLAIEDQILSEIRKRIYDFVKRNVNGVKIVDSRGSFTGHITLIKKVPLAIYEEAKKLSQVLDPPKNFVVNGLDIVLYEPDLNARGYRTKHLKFIPFS